MKILWITNSMFPGTSEKLGLKTPVVGGWLFAMASQLIKTGRIKLGVATLYHGRDFKSYDSEDVSYYLLPGEITKMYDRKLEVLWRKICNEFQPDIIHIHGSEFSHGLACMRSCPGFKYVMSVQGLVNVISGYYLGGIDSRDIFRNITFRDIIRRDSLFHAKKIFEKKGILEKEYFLRSQHVIGRTGWDKIHSQILNPEIRYHFCNELLRDSFYKSEKWDIDNMSPHTIFLSQAYYPIKGLHKVLMAIALLKNDFPDITLRVAGYEFTNVRTFSDRIRLTGYGSYILRIIRKHKLNGNVVFTGVLDEEQIAAEYRKAHIFICPSIIENSPNSLGEAQILGVPSIATFTGGIPDMVVNEESGLLYYFDDHEMLAFCIRRIFKDRNLALRLSEKGRMAALKRHDREKNSLKMLEIYDEIFTGK